MKRILILATHYLPAFKAGGPVKSLRNLLTALSDRAQFHLVTSDRDLGDDRPYADVPLDAWVERGEARIKYLSGGNRFVVRLWRALREHRYDVIYFNSFFSLQFTILPLALCRLFAPRATLVVAPRGELGPGALAIKPGKKQFFLRMAKWFRLHRRVVWHATSEQEAGEIRAVMGPAAVVRLAGNILVAGGAAGPDLQSDAPPKADLVYLSRIAKKKNLLLLLAALKRIEAPVSLDIYGPIEDAEYWRLCEQALRELSENKRVRWLGPVRSEDVVPTLSHYDAFVLPTLNENFGHVILEALEAGCFVMTTTETPWAPLVDAGAGFLFAPTDAAALAAAVERFVARPRAQRLSDRRNAVAYFKRYMESQRAIADMAAVLEL
jgi:glycosyltransferase involved in cell wall biosynthesis